MQYMWAQRYACNFLSTAFAWFLMSKKRQPQVFLCFMVILGGRLCVYVCMYEKLKDGVSIFDDNEWFWIAIRLQAKNDFPSLKEVFHSWAVSLTRTALLREPCEVCILEVILRR